MFLDIYNRVVRINILRFVGGCDYCEGILLFFTKYIGLLRLLSVNSNRTKSEQVNLIGFTNFHIDFLLQELLELKLFGGIVKVKEIYHAMRG